MTHGEWGFLFRTARLRNRFTEQCALKDPFPPFPSPVPALDVTCRGNAHFPIVIVFRYADDPMGGFEDREEAERLQGINQCGVSEVTGLKIVACA